MHQPRTLLARRAPAAGRAGVRHGRARALVLSRSAPRAVRERLTISGERLLEMKAADAAADRLVAGRLRLLLAYLPVAGGAIELQGILLQLRCAEHQLPGAALRRFHLCSLEHFARDAT